ncbi:MAG TPA: hypothetical protein DCL61_05615, partial [Cyanobacteria bacterium UBA12227]|nr:hypothetical protein [Cyanobacteria bacterium UBA12227]HBY76277.1 hypothetical protein [Cyanobacteria bacterium UBA11148]
MSSSNPNSPAVQFFYVPLPENQLLQALQTIEAGGPGVTPTNPVQTYISIAAVANGTIVYYDHGEDGYEADISNPTQSTTQIWGDGDISNGAAPGVTTNAGDVINAGTVIVLNNAIDTTVAPTTPYPFSGGDKIGATKSIAVTRTGWATGPNSLLAGGLEVFDTDNWGTDYRVPVGVNIPDGTDFQMFQYTGLAIMAGELGAVISVDVNADGDFTDAGDVNNLSLTQGQSYLVNGGVNVGARVVSDKAVQVDLITGDIGSNYESRDSALLPTNLWSDSYYTPVSTASSVTDLGGQGTFTGTDTTVWLYNPGTTAINVTYERRVGGVLTSSTISVPGGVSGGYTKQVIPDGSGAHFFTPGGQKFYAFSTTDSNNSNVANNLNWDWGYTLVPEDSLTTQVLIGLGIGRDPTSSTSPTQNGNPVWVTTVGNGETPTTVYIDYNGDNLGAFTDPNGNKYDATVSLKELERAKIYDPDGDQTGMLLYTLTPGVKLAAAWGQDPSAANAGAPGLDVGSGIPPLPEFDAGKNGTLLVDADGDGFVSPGDTLLYTISIPNISRAPVPDIKLLDNLPADTTYILNSTKIDRGDGLGFVSLADAGTTAFPLDEGGAILGTIGVNKTFTVTFEAKIDAFNDLTPGTTNILNTGKVSALGEEKPIQDVTPLYGRIGDFVWKDLDGDGVQDGGLETGISGVTLNLILDANGNGIIDGGETIVSTQTTNASGGYLFTGLLGGNYIVDVVDSTVPASHALTTANDPKPVTLAAGQAFLTADFGYQPLGNITGNVKEDTNGDGIGDTNLSGVTLQLLDSNGNPVDIDPNTAGIQSTTTT